MLQQRRLLKLCFEDTAAQILKTTRNLKTLQQKKIADPIFKSPEAQLEWVYKHSVYYEKAHLQYQSIVYKIKKLLFQEFSSSNNNLIRTNSLKLNFFRFQPGYFSMPSSNWPWGTLKTRLHFKPMGDFKLVLPVTLKMWYVFCSFL
jgi:hypothetical protein